MRNRAVKASDGLDDEVEEVEVDDEDEDDDEAK